MFAIMNFFSVKLDSSIVIYRVYSFFTMSVKNGKTPDVHGANFTEREGKNPHSSRSVKNGTSL